MAPTTWWHGAEPPKSLLAETSLEQGAGSCRAGRAGGPLRVARCRRRALAPHSADSRDRLLQTHRAPSLSFSSEHSAFPRTTCLTLQCLVLVLNWAVGAESANTAFCFPVMLQPLFSAHLSSPPDTTCREQELGTWQTLSKHRLVDWLIDQSSGLLCPSHPPTDFLSLDV